MVCGMIGVQIKNLYSFECLSQHSISLICCITSDNIMYTSNALPLLRPIFCYVWKVLKHVSCSFIHWKACSLVKRLSHLGPKPAILLRLPHYPRAALLPTEITRLLGQISISKWFLWMLMYNVQLTKNSCLCFSTVQQHTLMLFSHQMRSEYSHCVNTLDYSRDVFHITHVNKLIA